jgi:dephospho-CoA kinase
MSVEKLAAILARQMPQAEKARRASFVLDTTRPREVVAADVVALIERIRTAR